MGRTVSNLYGTTANIDVMTLEIVSHGIYALEITFKTDHYNLLKPYNWCFDSGKGLVYFSDLSMNLASKMGYKTPRIYLRDYLMYMSNLWENAKPSMVWYRRSIEDYEFDLSRCKPIRVEVPATTK